jgi:O-antigen/teichoic acid export membrane protein
MNILYGDQWDASVPLAQALSVWGCFNALMCFSDSVLTAWGGIRKLLVKEACTFIIRLTGICVGLQFGLFGAALGFAAGGVVEVLVSSYLTKKQFNVGLMRTLGATRKSATVAICALVAPLMVQFFAEISPGHYWIPTMLAAFGSLCGWLLGIFLAQHRAGHEVAQAFTELRRRLGKIGKTR